MSLRASFFTAALTLALCSVPSYAVEGYAFVAPGGASGGGPTFGTLHAGGGIEHRFHERIGVGGEIGALAPWRNFSGVIGIGSINGSYYFARRGARLDPFVTGGYTLAFRSGTLSMGNFGGGTNIWLNDRAGIRLEFRDHVRTSRGSDLHYWGFRFGVALR